MRGGGTWRRAKEEEERDETEEEEEAEEGGGMGKGGTVGDVEVNVEDDEAEGNKAVTRVAVAVAVRWWAVLAAARPAAKGCGCGSDSLGGHGGVDMLTAVESIHVNEGEEKKKDNDETGTSTRERT